MDHTVIPILLLLLLNNMAGAGCTGLKSRSQPTSTEMSRIPTVSQLPPTGVPQVPTLTKEHQTTCIPTHDDGVSPSYQPDTPVRSIVGKGHVLTGVVRSSKDCAPIAGVKLELWPEEGNMGHPDASRATLFADAEGRYRFECNPPDHIHMRISADGYQTIGVNSYHPEGKPEDSLEIVLKPAP